MDSRSWGLIALIVGAVLVALLGQPAIADLSQLVYQRVDPSDWAKLRDESVTSDDATTVAGLTEITAISPGARQWVGCSLRFAGATDSADVTPLFYTAGGTLETAGDTVTLTATAVQDGSGQYSSERAWWETAGAARVKFRLSSISGTVEEVWGGTR